MLKRKNINNTKILLEESQEKELSDIKDCELNCFKYKYPLIKRIYHFFRLKFIKKFIIKKRKLKYKEYKR